MVLVNGLYGVYSNKPMFLTTKYMYCTFALQNILYQYYKYENDAFYIDGNWYSHPPQEKLKDMY